MVYWLVLLVLASQTGHHAVRASDPSTVVRPTTTGAVQGYVHTLRSTGKMVERYLGLPYATPPVGERRFQNPIPPSKWDGVLPTTSLPPACIQEHMETAYILTHNPKFDGRMSEDCLYINIYVPHNTSQERQLIPVLVYVHGGSNMVGMGAMFHGDVLASTGDLIVVTLNYRLGAFGFLSMPQLGMMGNYGLFDQNLAFKWVKDNIASFGGDHNRVTILGHSAGAVDVGHHILSPMAKGLFQSAIMMSGSPTAYWGFIFDSDAEDDVIRRQDNLELLNCGHRNRKETIKCLIQLRYDKLSNTTFKFRGNIYNFTPVIDGRYLVDDPVRALDRMTKEDADLQPSCRTIMIGVTHDEGSLTAEVILKGAMNIRPRSKGHITPTEDVDLWDELPDTVFTEFKGFKDIAEFIYTSWLNELDATSSITAFSKLIGDNTFTAPAIKMADGFTGLKGNDVYVYRFNHISAHTPYPAWMGVPHGEDQFYLFGSPVEEQELRNYTNDDVEISLKFMQLWTRFIYDQRNVSIPDESFQLSKYSPNESYIEISNKARNGAFFETKRRLRKKFTHFWNDVIPVVVSKQLPSNPEKDSKDKDDKMVQWITRTLLCVFVVLSLCLLAGLIYHIVRNKRGTSEKKHELIEDSGNSIVS